MHRPLLAALLLLASCGSPDDRAENEAAPSTDTTTVQNEAVQGEPERGIFTILKGGQPILTERFTRTAERLETELTAPGEERVVQTATLTPEATVSRMEIREDAGASPATLLVITVQGDTAAVEARQGEEVESGRIGGARDALPVPVGESPAMLEQILRRARVVGGERVQVPIVDADGQVSSVTVHFTGADGARIQAGETEWTVSTDAAGRLLSGSSAAQDLAIRREAGAAGPP